MKKKEDIPELDLSELSEEDREEYKKANRFPLGWGIFFAVMAVLIIACIIVIVKLR